MLDSWNVEADHFRKVARAATRGQPPTALTTYAALEMKEALEALLAEVEEALQSVPPLHAIVPGSYARPGDRARASQERREIMRHWEFASRPDCRPDPDFARSSISG